MIMHFFNIRKSANIRAILIQSLNFSLYYNIVLQYYFGKLFLYFCEMLHKEKILIDHYYKTQIRIF